MKEIAIQYLEKNIFLNIDMIEAIKHEPCEIIYANQDGVCIFLKDSNMYMLSMDNIEVGEKLIEQMDIDNGIVIHQLAFENKVREVFNIQDTMDVYHMIYLKQEVLPYKSNGVFKPLTIENHEFVCQHYQHVDDPDYISQILNNGWLYGIYEGDQLAGFIGRHGEGSMGLLEVLPAFKRKYYGSDLMKFMILHYKKSGRIPYSQVIVGNKASHQLHQSLGFECDGQVVKWLF